MSEILEYPHIYRMRSVDAVGVKTFINGCQYGHVSRQGISEAEEEQVFASLEQELRDEIETNPEYLKKLCQH